MFKVEIFNPFGMLFEVKIFFKHYNPDRPEFSSGDIPGTECHMHNEKDEQVAFGETELYHCDTYCKEFGRKLALTRAIATMPREERTKIWKEYFASRGINHNTEG